MFPDKKHQHEEKVVKRFETHIFWNNYFETSHAHPRFILLFFRKQTVDNQNPDVLASLETKVGKLCKTLAVGWVIRQISDCLIMNLAGF